MGLDQAECEVKRWNLRGQLRPWPRDQRQQAALLRLRQQGRIAWVAPTRTSLGGWHWVGGAIALKSAR